MPVALWLCDPVFRRTHANLTNLKWGSIFKNAYSSRDDGLEDPPDRAPATSQLWNVSEISQNTKISRKTFLSPVNGGREEGDDPVLWPGYPAGHSVAGLRPVAAHVGWLVPQQYHQSGRRGGERLAHLGHNSLQVTARCNDSTLRHETDWLVSKCVFVSAVTRRRNDRRTLTKHDYSSKRRGSPC